MDDLAALDGHHAVVDAEVVGNLAVVVDIHHDQVGLSTRFKGAEAVGATQSVGSVEGGSGDGLGGCEAHRVTGNR